MADNWSKMIAKPLKYIDLSDLIKLVFVAQFSAKHAALRRNGTKTDRLGIRIMCLSGATCLFADCCFSKLALSKSSKASWSSTKSKWTSSSQQCPIDIRVREKLQTFFKDHHYTICNIQTKNTNKKNKQVSKLHYVLFWPYWLSNQNEKKKMSISSLSFRPNL
jgi:hypothetical protein